MDFIENSNSISAVGRLTLTCVCRAGREDVTPVAMADAVETVEPVEADIPAPKPDSEEAPPPPVAATTPEEENAPAHTLDLPKGATTGGPEDEGIPAPTPDENVTLDVPLSGDPQSAAEDAASSAEDGAAEELVVDPDLPVS